MRAFYMFRRLPLNTARPWLLHGVQGIRGSERSRLLALCLAALEAQVAAMPAGDAAVGGGGDGTLSTVQRWRQLSTVLMALTSVAAATVWLGYAPAALLEAAAQQLAAADPSVLRAAGLQAAAEAVAQQAAMAAGSGDAAAEAADAGQARGVQEDASMSSSSEVQWYCLEEKVQLYCSVLRLLTCATIEQQQPQQQEEQMGTAAAAATRTSGVAGPSTLAVCSGGSLAADLARQQAALALVLEQQRQRQPSSSLSIR